MASAMHLRADSAPRETAAWPRPGLRAHLLGIGGCGMSGLARMLAAGGARVTGTDAEATPVTRALRDAGIVVDLESDDAPLPDDAELVVASAAVKPDHRLMLEATGRGLPTLSYAEALGRCMPAATSVAVAGTHGKSTTCAMLGHALIRCGIDPTVIVGATCPQLADAGGPSTGFRLGAPRIPRGPLEGRPGVLVAEACEFNRSFHNLRPTVAAVMNVEADHLDIYGSLDAVVHAFRDFANLLPPEDEGGTLLIAHEGAHRREVTAGVRARVETIGFAPASDWQVTYDSAARRVGLIHKGRPVCDWVLALPGDHMAMNAAFAAALTITLGGEPRAVADALQSFRGLDRRMQHLADVRAPGAPPDAPPVRVYDDYGHHPTEIDRTLRALREFERPEDRGGRLLCVFQPHQHSRTRFLLEEFAQAFTHADVVVVPHIYFVRDSEIEKSRVNAADLVDRLRASGVHAMHLYPFEAIVEQLQNVCRPGDLLVVMGAGPVWKVARGFIDTAPASRA